MNWTTILAAAIPAIATMMTTLITSASTKKDAEKNSIRSQILTMILSDKVEGIAENSVVIHQLFDHYKNDLKGNSWLASKVDDYDRWVDGIKDRKEAKQ